MRRSTKIVLAAGVALLVVAAACGQPVQQPPPLAHVTAGQVYVAAADQRSVQVVDWATRHVARTLPAAAPAPDWGKLYQLQNGAVQVLDPLTGRVTGTHPAPDWATSVRPSANGRWLVFGRDEPADRFQVQDAAWNAPPSDVRLQGRFTYDGVSPDGRRLYLLERLDAEHYQVRMYDLLRGALAPYVISEKSEIGQPMSGTALGGFTTRDGAMQLTLYQRDAKGQAFVHALPVGQEQELAFCVDLPGPADGWGFAAAPDGQRFYAVNPAAGRIVELLAHAGGPPELRQRQIDAVEDAGDGPAVAVSPDGRTVYAGTGRGVLALDAGTLKPRGMGLIGRPITALAAAPDGGGLYAVAGATRLLRLDPRTLAVAGEAALDGPLGAILHAT